MADKETLKRLKVDNAGLKRQATRLLAALSDLLDVAQALKSFCGIHKP